MNRLSHLSSRFFDVRRLNSLQKALESFKRYSRDEYVTVVLSPPKHARPDPLAAAQLQLHKYPQTNSLPLPFSLPRYAFFSVLGGDADHDQTNTRHRSIFVLMSDRPVIDTPSYMATYKRFERAIEQYTGAD